MKINYSCTNMTDISGKATIEFDIVEKCPLCHVHILAESLFAVAYMKNNGYRVTVLNYCPGCHSCFITTYSVNHYKSSSGIMFTPYLLISSEPIRHAPEKFEDNIVNLSKTFVEVYNQSKQAESLSLNHIAGMGYRKAIEFLIKDYAIHSNPDDEDTIKSMPLMQCIKEYIENPKIQTLAVKSVWLGNDETHYVRKHTDKDIDDLKRLLNACVNYINMELTLEEAEAIQKA